MRTKEMWRGHPLFSLENLYRAYRKCRRRKRTTLNALAFEWALETNLVELHEELESGTYRPGQSLTFLVKKPKEREIFAADFRDRVVHHVLVAHLEPLWERRYIHDSYACRRGKGTHKAVERLRSFARKATANGTRRAWYLQLDVRGFFVSMNRTHLYRRLSAKEPDPAVRWLIRSFVFQDPARNCRLRGARRADFLRLSAHKTLFKAAPDCGLPIGNLTSQFFANVYLDELDQFVKHVLKARWSLRYCDDILLLSADREELEAWEAEIREFLPHRLGLALNARRKLRPVSDGIDFLGYVVRPDYLLVRRRVVGALRERLEYAGQKLREAGMRLHGNGRVVYPWPWALLEEVRQWLNSYLAHLQRASSSGLTQSLWKRFFWLREYFRRSGGKVQLRLSLPRTALTFREQKRWFQELLPGHVLMVQAGRFWEMIMCPSLRSPDTPANVQMSRPPRIHARKLPAIKPWLWDTRLPVAWIGETGRRVTSIAERVLVCRWAAGRDSQHNLPGSFRLPGGSGIHV